MRRDADVAPVRERRESADLEVLPLHSAIVAAEESHAHGEEYGAGRGITHRERVRVQHAFGFAVALDLALEVWPRREADELVRAVVPVLAAVEAPHHTADLEGREDLVGSAGHHRETHHAAGERHRDPVGLLHVGQLPPRGAEVIAPPHADG